MHIKGEGAHVGASASRRRPGASSGRRFAAFSHPPGQLFVPHLFSRARVVIANPLSSASRCTERQQHVREERGRDWAGRHGPGRRRMSSAADLGTAAACLTPPPPPACRRPPPLAPPHRSRHPACPPARTPVSRAWRPACSSTWLAAWLAFPTPCSCTTARPPWRSGLRRPRPAAGWSRRWRSWRRRRLPWCFPCWPMIKPPMLCWQSTWRPSRPPPLPPTCRPCLSTPPPCCHPRWRARRRMQQRRACCMPTAQSSGAPTPRRWARWWPCPLARPRPGSAWRRCCPHLQVGMRLFLGGDASVIAAGL